MDHRLQRRIQRYGWDLAADDYEPLWSAQLAGVQAGLLRAAALAPGERVLDVASGSGLVSIQAVDAASRVARQGSASHLRFARMDAERLEFPDASFDVVLCSLGLMYMPDPGQAVREMRRVLRPGGRLVASVWGERARCGWAALFEIVDAEIASEVCPLFFGLGQPDALARLCRDAGFEPVSARRMADTLAYADGDEACRAAFVGGPVALAWSRFSPGARERARTRYLEALAGWRDGAGYRVPAEFVIVTASVPDPAAGS
jgi:SAM-dependent methyltransferase